MGDVQSAQRDEAAAEAQSAVQDGPSGDSTHDKLIQNNKQISDINGKSDETTTEVNGHCEPQIAKEAITVKEKVTSVTKSKPEEVTNVQIIQENLSDVNEEEPIEIINVDDKQNDLNESFRKFFSSIGLKLTVKREVANKAIDEAEEEVQTVDAAEETVSTTKYEDVEQSTDLNAVQDNDSTTCPTLTDGSPVDVAERAEENITEIQEVADNMKAQEETADEELASPIKRFFTTGIFAGLSKKKKEEEAVVEEPLDISKNDATEEQQQLAETSPDVAQQEDNDCKDEQGEEVQAIATLKEDNRGKSPSSDQDSESEITSSQEKAQMSPFKRLFSGSFKKRSKRQKRRKSSDAKLSDSGEHIENIIVASGETKEQQDVVEETPSTPPQSPPPTAEPQEELSAWEAFKKLMTPKKSLKRPSEEIQAVAVDETKPSDEERVSDRSTEEGRKRKDSAHSWEAVLCGSGRRRSRKTSDSEDDQKEARQAESSNEADDIVSSTPKQAGSPSDSESSTWKSFKKFMTPKRKPKEEEESKDNAQSDSEGTQEEMLFSLRKLLPGRKKKQDQLSSDEGEREAVSMDEDSETPAVVPLSEFDQSEAEETAKTEAEIEESNPESEQEHILEIPKTFVQEIQEHQVTPIIALNQDQDELTEFSKYQPLSDIPEEGHITETVATSFIEEVIKDDTIAEDMIEITSEAITAPEPVDITMADETDELMLSAASHLPESSKTSGNATPVPAEYDVKDTEVLLKEVVEIISTPIKANTVCPEELPFERVAAIEEQNVMGLHEQSEAVIIETGLQVNQLQNTDLEVQVIALSESLSEFKDAISTEYVSEVSKVEFESAKVDFDEIHTAYPQQVVKQESVDDSEYMIESISEVPEYTEIVLQDQDTNQDALTSDYVEEAKAMRPECIEPLSEEKVEAVNKSEEEKKLSDPELPIAEVDSMLEICKREEAICEDEAVMESDVQSDQPGESVQPESESLDVQPPEETAEWHKEATQELSNEQTLEQLQEEIEIGVKVETVVEDFKIVDKQDAEEAQEPTLESPNPPDVAVQEFTVQEEECLSLSGLARKEESTEDINAEPPEQDIGENNQDIVEELITDVSEAIQKEEVTSTEQEDEKLLDVRGQEIASFQAKDTTNNLYEEKVDDKFTEETVSLVEEEIKEQITEDKKIVEEALQVSVGELEEQSIPESAADDIDSKIDVEETTESQEQEMVPEGTEVQNGQDTESSAKVRKVVFKLDPGLKINGEHTEAKPSEAQVITLDHSQEVTEDLEGLCAVHTALNHEDTGIVQTLEETVDMEKSCELFLSTTEEPIHEVSICEADVNVVVELKEEVSCTVKELAEVEHATLPEESMAISQQVTPTMPDLMIIKTVEHSETITEQTSIPCVDSAEVLDEPKHEVHLTEGELVGIQGEKEEEIVPLVTLNADVQNALVAQMTTCTCIDVASGIPNVSTDTTSQIDEPMLGTVTSEQECNELIETTTPLEVNIVSQVAQESETVVLMHIPSVKCEDNHQMQVQVVDVNIQSAAMKVDKALEIGVQQDKEVVNTCHETVEKVESVSATSEIEQEMVSEKDKVAIQEVVQHVKELASELEDKQELEEPCEDRKIIETQEKEDAVSNVLDSVMAKDEVLTETYQDVKEVQKAVPVENQVASPSDTAVAVSQNTGIISSSGNVEAPSSLSLEFKLNIQFGLCKAPTLPSLSTSTETSTASSPPSTAPSVDRSEPTKPTAMPEVGVGLHEVSRQENEQKKTEITMAEVAVQATETAEKMQLVETEEQLPSEEIKATEIIHNKTSLIDVSSQSMEIAEQVEEKVTEMEIMDNQPTSVDADVHSIQQGELNEIHKITEVVCPNNQAAITVQPDKELEKKDVGDTFMELVVPLSEDPIKQTEDEDENQDVWMDAEEDIDGRKETASMPLSEIEESFESQPDYFQESKSDLEESFDNTKKTLKCESEEEDFAAALEDLQIGTTIATTEWD